MARRPDGTAVCDRCGLVLAGYGAVHGLIVSHLDGDVIMDLIFCYRNGCRDVALNGLLYRTGSGRSWCATCETSILGVATAAMCSDVSPSGGERLMAFCYANGHRDQLLDQGKP